MIPVDDLLARELAVIIREIQSYRMQSPDLLLPPGMHVVCNRVAMDMLERLADRNGRAFPFDGMHDGKLFGVPISVGRLLPDGGPVWEWDDDPFFEFEESDEVWAKFFGLYGKIAWRSYPTIFLVNIPELRFPLSIPMGMPRMFTTA